MRQRTARQPTAETYSKTAYNGDNVCRNTVICPALYLNNVVVVVIFYFFSQDAQANLPSRRGRDVPSSHKKRIWCDDRKKKKKKEEKEETQPRAELEASMRKKVLNEKCQQSYSVRL